MKPTSHEPLPARLRPEFPLLGERVGQKKLVFLDAASTTPKPRVVIEAVRDYYESSTANVHRGVHALADRATELYEKARLDVAGLLGASPSEVVFVRGATEAINLVAHGLGLGVGDEVVFPASEHHANFLPWRTHATPVIGPIDEAGVPRWDAIEPLLGPRTKLLAFAHVSHVTGAIAPVSHLVARAHARGIPVLLDAAQSLSHLPIDVGALGVDFLAASAHKAFGPTGVGVLFARSERLARLSLYQVGGGMVASNPDSAEPGHDADFVPRDPPFRFEAGTPAIEAAIGFGAAVRFLRGIGWDALAVHERGLAERLRSVLAELPDVRLLGADSPLAIATFGFTKPGMDAEAVARALSVRAGICVSAGTHCAHVLHARLGMGSTVRVSAHGYNTLAEIDAFGAALREVSGGGGSASR